MPPNDGTQMESKLDLRVALKTGAGHDLLIDDLASGGGNAVYLENVLGQIQAHGLYCHWVAPFLAVDDNYTLARLMPVEQEPSTSSAVGRIASTG